MRDTEEDDTLKDGKIPDETLDIEDGLSEEDEDEQSASEDENETTVANSYVTLLQSLNAGQNSANSEPARKKRKLVEEKPQSEHHKTEERPVDGASTQNKKTQATDEDVQDLDGEVEADEEEHSPAADADSEDEEVLLQDPFEKHYSAVTEQDLKDAAKLVDGKHWQTQTSTLQDDIRRSLNLLEGHPTPLNSIRSTKDLYLKERLLEAGSKLTSNLSPDEKNLAGAIFNHADIIYGNRTLKNSTRLRDLSALHALNHVFKTRDRVLKNNAKLSASGTEPLDLRDQGFTRPKVLIIVPTKQACVRFVDSIVNLSEPDQQENKSRFLDTYSHDDSDEWADKPEDFRALFGGNHEEDFRIGLKFTRKTIKYFSGFYNSDIIIGSPLGLMRTITTGGGGGGKDKDTKKKTHDADFLSSIEMVIMDHANALQMQNWQHVDYVFSQLNLLPKDSHGCDFSRVRHWYLDGQAKYLRQTIVFSDFLSPEINALTNAHCFNIAGRVKYTPTYPGAMLSVSSVLPISNVPQTFLRIPSTNPLTDADTRFKYFTTSILPPLVRDARHQKGILLYATSYADFVRLRNHLSTTPDATNLSFGSVSEYTPVKEVARARSHFMSGRYALLLYSERAHHHFRYRLRGVRKVLFYSVPENPVFWPEVIGLLGLGLETETQQSAKGNMKGAVRALFSKWDAMKLERIVGTERVGRLIHDRGGDTFDFV
ncbi:rRNA-binding ribosome biosynthesis protein utp25 [Exophiala xenobiotica]|nr:rRNA-binding ribosome biosynthesis protein utp25 [Exophiala xenobiotica]KAK5250396.1 rRNA-binding ribosome biosynthesis protein utp25 [Exophiala xenobiotica]KAK5281723.1 rRNA-binding ribosome biosynthesis protein utp25 [Exophiala xenobiotica]KAK5351331.1 rRNA-binding ribosome biosynthesis protein utp25 [Exophiala xenobiotica]KAK5375911.1 rRNA-binding ribosome biosynthesis protein utp25 [Exophiala xenobiotica]